VTAEGTERHFTQHACQIPPTVNETDNAIAGLQAEKPTAEVKIANPNGFCRVVTRPKLSLFQSRHPIQLEIMKQVASLDIFPVMKIDIWPSLLQSREPDLIAMPLLCGKPECG